jgi:hypothetical protein
VEIEKDLHKIKKIEQKLYGVELFDLKTEEILLKEIGNMNLRKDVMKISSKEIKRKQSIDIIH